MKKPVTILVMSLMLTLGVNTVKVHAQTNGGPDAYGYIWRDSNDPNGPAYNWIDIAGAPGAVQVTGMGDDNIRGPYTIGFPFHFYWYDVTTFRVGSNGYLGFTATPVAHPFPTIPFPTGVQNWLAVMATDLTFTDVNNAPIPGAAVWYWTSPGSDSLIVSWINVPFWVTGSPGYSGTNTFQVILSGADSSITYQYQNQAGASNNTGSFCTIGIENISGNVGLQHSNNVYPPSSYAIKFYYPASTTFQVNDASTVYTNNETTGGLFLSANGSPYVMTAQIRNSGNQALAAFNVNSRVVNSLNQNQVTSTVTTNALSPGDIQDIIFPDIYQPTTAGTFRHINNTQLLGDATPSNNEKQLELQVVDTTQASILLSFDNGTDSGLGGLSWSGGNGGAGMHFIPPFYPSDIMSARVYIVGNINLVGFYIYVLADDGIDGAPGTLLDSIFVPPVNVVQGTWNVVPMSTPITLNSGGFYVAWMMGGDGITIGQNQLAPISNRTYEVLGNASNPLAWADYRYRELEDLMINAVIRSTPVGLTDVGDAFFGQVFPNPSNGFIALPFSLNSSTTLSWKVTDLTGKLILKGLEEYQSGESTLQVDASSLNSGLYLLHLTDGERIVTRKFSLID
jgi:hypothetical protein